MEYSPIVDWWSLAHLCGFVWLASAIHSKWEPRWWVHIILWLTISYGWEIPEHFLQRMYPETWVVIECPLNAWLMDPLANGVGWFIGVLIGRWSKARKHNKIGRSKS